MGNPYLRRGAFFVLLAFGAATVSAQGLAAAAAKEKERRKQVAPASNGKVYTESDMGGSRDTGDNNPGTTSATASTDTRPGPTVAGPASAGNEEARWRDRFAQARSSIQIAESELNGITASANAKATHGAPASPPCVPSRDLTYDQLKKWSCGSGKIPDTGASGIEPARQRLEQAKQRLRTLEDEARRAGVPAGWQR